MSYKVNGKDVTKQELTEILKDDSSVIANLTISEDRDPANPEMPLTNEGFEVNKDFIAHMSETMDSTGAGHIVAKFLRSRKLMGKNFYVIIADQDDVINEVFDLLADEEDEEMDDE